MDWRGGNERDEDFLAFTGEAERNGWRVAFWFGLGLALAATGLMVVDLLVAVIDKSLLEPVEKEAAPLRVALQLGVVTLVLAEIFVSYLLAAKFVFQRPAWTFISPVRRFSFTRLATGAGVAAVFAAGGLVIRLARGKEIAPFVTDLRVPDLDRFGFVGAGAVFSLLAIVALEGFLRGLIPQVIGAFTRSKILISLVAGAVSGALYPHEGAMDAAAQFVLGVALTWSVLELAGLEYAIGVQATMSLIDLAIAGPATDDAGGMTLVGLAYYTALAAVTAAAASGLKRFRRST